MLEIKRVVSFGQGWGLRYAMIRRRHECVSGVAGCALLFEVGA